MHIVIATPAFPPFVGGGERHTGTLARRLVDRGQNVTVLTSAALEEPDFWEGAGHEIEIETNEPGLTIIRVPIRPMPNGLRGLLAWRKGMVMLSTLPGTQPLLQSMAKRVPGLLRLDEALGCIREPVDVIHGFNISWECMMMTGWTYAQQIGRPFVASPLAHLGTGPHDRVARNSTMHHQRHMLSTADLLLTNTALEAQGLRARGVRQGRVRVAGPGVDIPEIIDPLPGDGKALKPYVLFVGRTSADKGALHAVQAVLRLRDRGSDIQLVLIGRETDEFRRFYNHLAVADQQAVHALGFVEESLKHAYLRNSVALLLPSSSDSFGIVLLESWLYKRPVIAADAGGIPAVVDDGKNGILIPFGDIHALAEAIRSLRENEQMNRALGENGFIKLNANYTWEVVTEKVLEAYQEAVDGFRLHTRVP